MALDAGDVVGRTGLAGAIADALEAVFPEFDEEAGRDGINAMAEGIITYLVANAEFTGTDSAGDSPDNISMI